MQHKKINRWVFVLIIFLFLFFHQADREIKTPLSAISMVSFDIDHARVPWVKTLMMGLTICFFPVWGCLYDRHTRKRVLAFASYIWGVTSWLVGISPTPTTYFFSSISNVLDDACHSGIFTMLGDLFVPRNRGKILGLMLITQPLAQIFGILLTYTPILLNWRLYLIVTGSVGLILALIIFFFIKEPTRGAREPGLIGIELTGIYTFDWEIAKSNLKMSSMLLLFVAGFFNAVPWTMFTSTLIDYMRNVHVIPMSSVYQVLFPSFVACMLGYPLGGFLGDIAFTYKKLGRIIVSLAGVTLPPLFFFFAMQNNPGKSPTFILLLTLVSFFTAFTRPNLIATVMDITLPEVRSTMYAVFLAFHFLGGLATPFLVSLLSQRIGLGASLLWVGTGAWLVGLLVQIGMFFSLRQDIEQLRRHMAYRSYLETHHFSAQ